MPATINLLPRKEFEITLESGAVIKGQFGTWSLKRFCQKQKITLPQLQNMKVEDYPIDYIVDFILSAVEYTVRLAKSGDFTFTDVDCCQWIDELGGVSSESVIALFNHSAAEADPTNNGQKKTEPELTAPV